MTVVLPTWLVYWLACLAVPIMVAEFILGLALLTFVVDLLARMRRR